MQILLNYRRKPVTDLVCGRIHEALQQAFPKAVIVSLANTVLPLPHMRPPWSIELVIIDAEWVSPHLYQTNDPVRRAIEAALQHRIPLVPLVLEDALLPKPEQLPPSIRRLPGFQQHTLRGRGEFRSSMQKLTDGLMTTLLGAGRGSRANLLLWAAVTVSALVGVALFAFAAFQLGLHLIAADDAEGVEPTPTTTGHPPPALVATSAPTNSVSTVAPAIGSRAPKSAQVAAPAKRSVEAADGSSPQPAKQLTDAECRASSRCKTSGHCSVKDNRCSVVLDADCRQSQLCSVDGECAAHLGQCVANSNKDCKASKRCNDAAACTASGGRCTRTSSADCALSILCKRDGQCSLSGGACVAGSDAECRQSTRCKGEGHCVALQGFCTTAEGKKASIQAAKAGL